MACTSSAIDVFAELPDADVGLPLPRPPLAAQVDVDGDGEAVSLTSAERPARSTDGTEEPDPENDPCTISLNDGELGFSGTFDIVLCKYQAEVRLDEEIVEWIRDKNLDLESKTEWGALHESRYGRMDHIFLSDLPEREKVQLLTAFYLTFQLSSDVCGGHLLCSTYAEIHRDYSFQDWHNN